MITPVRVDYLNAAAIPAVVNLQQFLDDLNVA